METDPAKVRAYYSASAEWERLESPAGALEFARAMQVVADYLPSPCRVLDLGGGPGRYAIELARRGHRVALADLSPVLLEQARERVGRSGVQGQIESMDEVGAEDLRRYPSGSFDAVLAFGPFYHLLSEAERSRAAREVCRVLVADGLAFVAFIPRLTAIAALIERAASSPEQVSLESLRRAVETGVFRNSSGVGFQEGYYALPGEIEGLLQQQGLQVLATISLRSIAYRMEKEFQSLEGEVRAEVEKVLESFSMNPDVVASSGHALVIARRQP
jgi:S-adenosylmethionine-dependent methyltransferase